MLAGPKWREVGESREHDTGGAKGDGPSLGWCVLPCRYWHRRTCKTKRILKLNTLNNKQFDAPTVSDACQRDPLRAYHELTKTENEHAHNTGDDRTRSGIRGGSRGGGGRTRRGSGAG
eukprot:3320289-Pyramimonas_sp.AAC.1